MNNKDLYTIIEASKILNISKQALYNKLKKQEFKKLIIEKDRIRYIKSIDIPVLKEAFRNKSKDMSQLTSKDSYIDSKLTEEVNYNDESIENKDSNRVNINEYIDSLKDQIGRLFDDNSFLKKEIEAKNEQIKKKDDEIEHTLYILKQAQEKIFLPEQKKVAKEEVSVTEEKINFLSKLFRRR